MFFDLGPKSATLLIFFVHAVVFGSLLLYRGIRDKQKSSNWLATFVLLCGMYIAPFMFGYAGWYSESPYRDILFYVPFQQLFLMAPILYFYVITLFNESYVFKKRDWYHFLPAIFYAIYSFVIWVTDQLILGEYYFYVDGRDKDLDLWYQVSGFFMMGLYLILSLRLYQQYRNNANQTVSFADSILYKWVQHFLVAFLALLIIRVLLFILNPEWANFGRKYWYYISFSILFYYISLSGYMHSIKLIGHRYRHIDFNQSLDQMLESVKPPISYHKIDSEKTSKAVIEIDEEIKSQIELLMKKDKAYENPELTLFDIAQELNSHPKKISQTINKGFEMNFNDFVNQYRIIEVVKAMKSDEGKLKSLLGIALDAGFNSKSTFNRAFKKQMKTTPQQYFKSSVSK